MPRRTAVCLELGALSVAAAPVVTYLAGLLPQERLGALGVLAVVALLDGMLIMVAYASARSALDRLLVVASFTWIVLVLDLITGARLQINTLWGYNPIGAGRFYGVGNIGFAVLTAVGLITATLLVQRARRSKVSLATAAGLFVVTVLVDAAPMFGADVGGVISLVPGLLLAWALLAGRRLSAALIAVAVVAALLSLAAFLSWDLSRPLEAQTHLARLYRNTLAAGPNVFLDTIERKVSLNLRIFRSTLWPYICAVALLPLVWLLAAKNRRDHLVVTLPDIHNGLLGGLVVSVLGLATNDSGIVIPAVVLSLLGMLAVLSGLHLSTRES